ncbi:pentapeptide repeat-containing protein [Microtetraspora sp. AC03309]|uniref:pentapeptide repeat-containing protein n=1 Tax=Microtetraspora sp. AC03309 TaxID=2779376 RepID=UPI001E632404|nr:pentapeptide repeat-containing protein [Microtetraspora sp. AC03309]MCC5581737.1 pentapeptide repeat-containing protein [Microtetraspora sp. AC03309]
MISLAVLTVSGVAALTALVPSRVLPSVGLTVLPDWARWSLAGLALSGVVSLGLVVLLGPAARRLAGERYPLTDEERRQLSVTDRIEAVNATRQTLLQSATGLVVIGGVVFTALGLWYTAQTLDTTQQGQITDRYTKAIEQLGNRQSLDVRLGGIYALERLAADSPRDHRTIYDVLAAFTREHDPAPETEITGPPATDIQAALTVIGRRDRDTFAVDLTALRAPEADLGGAYLSGANLGNANLSGADLHNANLSGADLHNADLRGAKLIGANLSNTDLGGASLTDVLTNMNLSGANLSNTDLRNMDLRGANLIGANLRGANLIGANLSGANLSGADLSGADLRGVTGMTQAQIQAVAETDATTKF